jgi:hypothetical protein
MALTSSISDMVIASRRSELLKVANDNINDSELTPTLDITITRDV